MAAPATSVDLLGIAAIRDPQAEFERLRAQGPVHYLERHRAWLLLDYDLIRLALSDERLTTDTITPMYERLSADERATYRNAETLLRGWMIFNDPPVHTMLRNPVRTAFTPNAVAKLRDDVAEMTDAILDSLTDRDTAEFVREIAFPLPAAVIAVLLGVPADRHPKMREWSTQLGALVMGKSTRPDKWERALRAAEEMQAYFGELVDQNRRHPTDNLITRMITAAPGSDGEILSDEQLVGACSLLLFGGHETTTSLLTTSFLHLTQRPDAKRQLLESPDLVDLFVEEMVRFDGPSKMVVRRARRTEDWEGYPFEAGQAVFCALMAGNRDPNQFDHPDQLIVDRHPNRHIGWGWGRHYCLGAQLAHLEVAVVIPKVLERFPNIALGVAPEELSWHPTIVGRTLRSLPVTLR